jgi:Flp pilus assembly protein CpaB
MAPGWRPRAHPGVPMTTTDARAGLASGPYAGSTSGGMGTPPARRLRPPRWRDRRLALGVILVLASVLLGARLLSSRDATTPVLIAARPLSPGHVLTAQDLTVGHVRLGAEGSRYWPAADLSGLQGHPILTAIAAGDLLARSAVGDTASPQPMREVSVPVDPSRLPPLQAGDLVDVFATFKANGTASADTVAVLRGVEYVGGGDTDSDGTVTVLLQVPVADAGILVRASETASLDLVLEQPAGDSAGDVGSSPVPAPSGLASSALSVAP